MYEIISNIIDHNWITQGAGEQQYIYYIAGAIIALLVVVIVDLIRDIFCGFFRG